MTICHSSIAFKQKWWWWIKRNIFVKRNSKGRNHSLTFFCSKKKQETIIDSRIIIIINIKINLFYFIMRLHSSHRIACCGSIVYVSTWQMRMGTSWMLLIKIIYNHIAVTTKTKQMKSTAAAACDARNHIFLILIPIVFLHNT